MFSLHSSSQHALNTLEHSHISRQYAIHSRETAVAGGRRGGGGLASGDQAVAAVEEETADSAAEGSAAAGAPWRPAESRRCGGGRGCGEMERRGTGRRVAVAAHFGRVGQCTARAKVAGLVARGGRTVQRWGGGRGPAAVAKRRRRRQADTAAEGSAAAATAAAEEEKVTADLAAAGTAAAGASAAARAAAAPAARGSSPSVQGCTTGMSPQRPRGCTRPQ